MTHNDGCKSTRARACVCVCACSGCKEIEREHLRVWQRVCVCECIIVGNVAPEFNVGMRGKIGACL